MGAIFGALGSETPKSMGPVRHMAETLAHRGTNPQNLEFPGGAIGYLEAPQSPPAPVRGLCDWPQENAAVAVAGQVNAPDHRAILEAFRERRLDHLRGSFVIAIRQDERVHLIRDGAGRRTIYHGHHAGQIYFAVEPKAIHTLPDFPRILRPAAVAQYLTFSFIPGPATMLENIHEVPAGHVVTLQAGCEPKLERWFVPENVEPENRGDEAWVEIFREHFGNAIDELRVPGQPAAVFLSGGIDSSIVTAELAARHDAPVKTFAIHFGERYPNELEFARSVSEHCATEHEEVRVEPRDFLPHLAEIVRALDEPIGDPVAMPNYLLAAYVARQGHDRVFNGEGGDPCFGGPKNLPMLLGHWYGGQDFSPGFRERAYLASYRRAYEELEHLLTPEFREQIDARRDLEAILTPFFTAHQPAAFLDKLLATNMRLKGAHLILPKVERMLAAHGMVPLSPLFDERLMRLVFQLPGRLKLHRGEEKAILKRAYRGRLPDAVIDRPKSGMRVPVHFWFQGEMRRFARKLLSPGNLRSAGIFDPRRVGELLRYDSERGPGRFGIRLWMLVTFELWRQQTIERAVE